MTESRSTSEPSPASILSSCHESIDGNMRHSDGALATDQRFPIASVSKTLTALLVARLAVEEVVSWSEPVPGLSRPVTWRSLLGHTAALPHELRPDHWERSALSRPELDRAMTALPDLGLPPGAWHYSNFGYGVAARALEERTGQDFATLLAEHLLGPLGMSRTSFPVSGSESPGVLGAAAPAGDLRSTVDDLMVLGLALAGLRPDVVSWRMLALVLEATVDNEDGERLGAGIRTKRVGTHQVLVSSGSILDRTTCVVAWPRRGASVVVAAGITDHGALRDTATSRWDRPEARRRWWYDGQAVHELRHGDVVELVMEQTTWPYPLFSGLRDGDRLAGLDWRGEPANLEDRGDSLVGAGMVLAADAAESAWRRADFR